MSMVSFFRITNEGVRQERESGNEPIPINKNRKKKGVFEAYTLLENRFGKPAIEAEITGFGTRITIEFKRQSNFYDLLLDGESVFGKESPIWKSFAPGVTVELDMSKTLRFEGQTEHLLTATYLGERDEIKLVIGRTI